MLEEGEDGVNKRNVRGSLVTKALICVRLVSEDNLFALLRLTYAGKVRVVISE